MTRFKLPIAILALSAAVSALVGFTVNRSSPVATAAPVVRSAGPSVAAQLQADFVNVNKKAAPSVVQIETSEGLGSGIVFDRKGNIVTNAHVVGNATSFTVTTAKGRQLKGTLVGKFEADDLAVIRVPSSSALRPAVFANSSKLHVGEIAMAIGNPLGLS